MDDNSKPKKRLMHWVICPNCLDQRIYYDEDYGDTCECWMCRGHGEICVPVDKRRSTFHDDSEDQMNDYE